MAKIVAKLTEYITLLRTFRPSLLVPFSGVERGQYVL